MKKQELIHMHGLLAEIAEYCTQDGVALDLDAYGSMETRPTSIHCSKSEHKDAVFALTNALTAEVRDEHVETVSTVAD